MASLIPRSVLLIAWAAATTTTETMPLRHAVSNHTIQVGEGGLATLELRGEYRYVGGQRFVLNGVADAEQHAFVDADADGTIHRFYWIQFERYLPASRGDYDYSQDAPVSIGGREWRANVRRYVTPPDPASDRGQLYAFFERAGFRVRLPTLRTRLVYLTAPDRRAELMIVYAEASTTDAPPAPVEISAMITRAQAGFRTSPP